MKSDISACFEYGVLAHGGSDTDIGSLPWNKHSDFTGVYLKNVLPADRTGGLFSCHLVLIEPLHAIGMHTHPASVELHEIIRGDGIYLNGGAEIAYRPGFLAVITENSPHEVRAGDKGLFLFAKFITVQA